MRKQDKMTLLDYEIKVNEMIALKNYQVLTPKRISDLCEIYEFTKEKAVLDELIVRLQPYVVGYLKGIHLEFKNQSLNDIGDCISFINECLLYCIENNMFKNIKSIADIFCEEMLNSLLRMTFAEDYDTTEHHKHDAMYNPYAEIDNQYDDDLELVEHIR